MERPEPKFVPGEVVEIQSVSHPEMNGTRCLIIEMTFLNMAIEAGSRRLAGPGWRYKTTAMYPGAHEKSWWRESALTSPPKDEPTTFDASIWQPKEVNA